MTRSRAQQAKARRHISVRESAEVRAARRAHLLDAHTLRDKLSYCPDTGLFKWIKPTGRRVKAGDVAGGKHPCGYVMISVCGHRHSAHRLAWLYVHGKWPRLIDHINGRRDDNRIDNLRECTASENSTNRLRWPRNSSGLRGVHWDKRALKWVAAIKFNGRYKFLGHFEDPIEAAEAYQREAEKCNGFNTGVWNDAP